MSPELLILIIKNDNINNLDLDLIKTNIYSIGIIIIQMILLLNEKDLYHKNKYCN